VKQECLSKLILFGERSLQRALTEYIAHYHAERNHQGKGNVLLFPAPLSRRAVERSIVESVSAACFGTTAEPREYFDSSRLGRRRRRARKEQFLARRDVARRRAVCRHLRI